MKKTKVHFMGIGGSGAAPTAMIAREMGFKVSGCDTQRSSYYTDSLISEGINIKNGHNSNHLENIDILAVSPSIFDIDPLNSEISEGKKKKILMTWQQFSGEFLQKDKFVISVAGTHGKSTTTVLTGLVLEGAGLNPIVEAGAIYKPWGSGYRVSQSGYFVCEADEFNNNFLNYFSSLAIINNVEMDHPEYFDNFTEVKQAFKKFIRNLKDPKILIVNEESGGLMTILQQMKTWINKKHVRVIGYYLNQRFNYPFHKEYNGKINNLGNEGSSFTVDSGLWSDSFKLGITGAYNISNSLGVLGAALELGISVDIIKSVFENFQGIGRRLELIGEYDGVKIYDDYAHHPTAVSSVLDTLRTIYKANRIWAIFEPHQISRLRIFINEFVVALDKADQVIITKTFIGREIHKNIKPVSIKEIVRKLGKNKSRYIEDFDSVSEYVDKNKKLGDIIVIFGAGNSYKLTRDIVSSLTQKNKKLGTV